MTKQLTGRIYRSIIDKGYHSSYLFGSGLPGELDFRITVDYSGILSDIARLLSNGIPLEQVIEDLWYSVHAESDWLCDHLYQRIEEVIMSDNIEFDNNPEPTYSSPLLNF